MNRKQAVLTLLAGVVPWVRIARAAPREDAPQPVRPAAPLPPTGDLQKKIDDLTRRVQELEAAQAATVGFTKSGNDLVLQAPSAGTVSIKSLNGNFKLDVNTVSVRAGTTLDLKSGSAATLEGASTVLVKAGATLEQKAGKISLN